MVISAAEWVDEERRLERVLSAIQMQLDARQETLDQHREELRATYRSVWAGAGFERSDDEDAGPDWAQHIERLQGQQRRVAFSDRAVKRLRRLADSPYFARIDFDGEPAGCGAAPDQFYIGLSSLVDERTGDFLVYDWRAPVAGMFYDFEPGPAWYESPAGTVSGQLVGKRQYRIRGGRLQYAFDSDLQIADDALQELLARATDTRLGNIVASIQREQNQVIRDENHRLIVVQGAAGSGKTSIALHRVAYLLYKYRKVLRAEDILIFSPNRLFSDYIAGVLPELGEENALQTTFQETAEHLLGPGTVLESFEDQLEFLLAVHDAPNYEERARSSAFKASEQFRHLFHNYVDYLERGEGLGFWDVAWQDRVLMTTAEMRELFFETYSYLPWHARVDKVRRRVLFLLKPLEDERREQLWSELVEDPGLRHLNKRELRRLMVRRAWKEFQPVVAPLEKWAEFDAMTSYRRLFTDDALFERVSEGLNLPGDIAAIRWTTAASLDGSRIPYEDAAPLLLLDGYSRGFQTRQLQHVIVDEAQDYSKLQYELLHELFPGARFTLLGDLNQSIHPYHNIERYEAVLGVLGEREGVLVNLAHTYRSTRELVEFTNGLLPARPPAKHVGRPGEKPRLAGAASPDGLGSLAACGVKWAKDKGAKSIGIICRTAAECAWAKEELQDKVDITLLTAGQRRYRGGTVLVPSYLAKGLEFDAVVVFNGGARAYAREEERQLFYTVCTRARHYLWVNYEGEPARFIRELHPDLYVQLAAH